MCAQTSPGPSRDATAHAEGWLWPRTEVIVVPHALGSANTTPWRCRPVLSHCACLRRNARPGSTSLGHCWSLNPRSFRVFVSRPSAAGATSVTVVVGLCCGLVVHTGAVALFNAYCVCTACMAGHRVAKLLGAAYLRVPGVADPARITGARSAGPDAGAQGAAPAAAPSLWRTWWGAAWR